MSKYNEDYNVFPKHLNPDFAIQIDDQDSNDNLEYFCSLFVTVLQHNNFELELMGLFPITREINDLAEIYEGFTAYNPSRIVLRLSPSTRDALTDLGAKIGQTAYMGATVGNPYWERISARTISSLNRFVRIIQEFQTRLRKR